MRHQLLVGQHGKTADTTQRQMGLPARHNHEVPAAEVTDAVQILEDLHIRIQQSQQGTSSFHVGEACEQPRRDPLCGDCASLRTAHTDEAMGAQSTTELLQPNTGNDATHRKAKQIDFPVIVKVPTDVIIELLREASQRNGSQAVWQMGHQQRQIMRLQSTDQSTKKMRRVPETMDKNERTPDG